MHLCVVLFLYEDLIQTRADFYLVLYQCILNLMQVYGGKNYCQTYSPLDN